MICSESFGLGVGTSFELISFELAGLAFELDELQSELELELEALELELELLEFEPVLKVELGLVAWLALRVELDCLAVEVEAEVEVELSSYWLEVELELSSWDAMAGLLLVEEAGGYVAPFPGPQGLAVRAPVIASAGGIGPTLHALVREQTGIA